MSSHETAELLATLGGLAESVSRIASALEANQLSSKNVLPYEGQPKLMEEEIALLKNQIKMKDAFMANVEANLKHKEELLKLREDAIRDKERIIMVKDKAVRERDDLLRARDTTIKEHEKAMVAKDALINDQCETIGKREKHIGDLNNRVKYLTKQNWSDFFNNVMNEVERFEQLGTSQLEKGSAVRNGAQKFLAMMKNKVSDREKGTFLPISILSKSQLKGGQGVKHKLEEKIGGEEVVKRVKTEWEE